MKSDLPARTMRCGGAAKVTLRPRASSTWIPAGTSPGWGISSRAEVAVGWLAGWEAAGAAAGRQPAASMANINRKKKA